MRPCDNSTHHHNACPTHCCKLHGCKYGYSCCPVVTGKAQQESVCEECERDAIDAIDSAPTLRDQFAMAALAGIVCANPKAPEGTAHDRYVKSITEVAYDVADAMLKVREAK